MTGILRGWRISFVAVAMLSASAGWPSVGLDQESDAQNRGESLTAEQQAAHRALLKARYATFKTALEKARADAEMTRRAFLDKQRAALDAQNAKVVAESAERV